MHTVDDVNVLICHKSGKDGKSEIRYEMKDKKVTILKDSKGDSNQAIFGAEAAFDDMGRTSLELHNALKVSADTKKFGHLKFTGEKIDSWTAEKEDKNSSWEDGFVLKESSGIEVSVIPFRVGESRRVLVSLERGGESAAEICEYPSYYRTTLAKRILTLVSLAREGDLLS